MRCPGRTACVDCPARILAAPAPGTGASRPRAERCPPPCARRSSAWQSSLRRSPRRCRSPDPGSQRLPHVAPQVRPQHLDPRPVRRRATGLPATARQQASPACARATRELADETALADPRFAGEQHDIAYKELWSALSSGSLPPYVLVWRPGFREWLHAQNVAELADALGVDRGAPPSVVFPDPDAKVPPAAGKLLSAL